MFSVLAAVGGDEELRGDFALLMALIPLFVEVEASLSTAIKRCSLAPK
jgi:hypothetical protein